MQYSRGSAQKPSELSIVTKAKELCSYVVTITQRSPKQFRFTFTSRMQNLCLDIIENIYLANETFVGGENMRSQYEQRLKHQHIALTKIKQLAYFAQLATECGAILSKQFEHIAKISTECQCLLGGWIKNDKVRFKI